MRIRGVEQPIFDLLRSHDNGPGVVLPSEDTCDVVCQQWSPPASASSASKSSSLQRPPLLSMSHTGGTPCSALLVGKGGVAAAGLLLASCVRQRTDHRGLEFLLGQGERRVELTTCTLKSSVKPTISSVIYTYNHLYGEKADELAGS
jgi:hypothetical protein